MQWRKIFVPCIQEMGRRRVRFGEKAVNLWRPGRPDAGRRRCVDKQRIAARSAGYVSFDNPSAQ